MHPQQLPIQRAITPKTCLPDNLTHLMGRCALLHHLVCNAVLAKYLHRPLINDMRFWEDGGSWVALEKNMFDRKMGEED
jgi:hypothetical protein